MSIAQLSPTSIAANPAYVNPQVKTENNSTPNQSNQAAQISVQSLKTDTVTLSPQALQMSSKAEESRENGAEKSFEKSKGQKY